MKIALLSLAVVCTTGAQPPLKECSSIQVLSFRSLSNPHRGNDAIEAGPSIALSPEPQESRVIAATVTGPILGSMDSPDVRTSMICTDRGMRMEALIIRSEHYTGSTLRNRLWRPLIELRLKIRSEGATLETIWKMESTNGTRIDHARTPPFPELSYPITILRTLRTSLELK